MFKFLNKKDIYFEKVKKLNHLLNQKKVMIKPRVLPASEEASCGRKFGGAPSHTSPVCRTGRTYRAPVDTTRGLCDCDFVKRNVSLPLFNSEINYTFI